MESASSTADVAEFYSSRNIAQDVSTNYWLDYQQDYSMFGLVPCISPVLKQIEARRKTVLLTIVILNCCRTLQINM
jgi:hypothetical protein